ncbi:MAG: DNA polymerase III subunit delta [Bacteroidota bacterium]|jgi:DNA polymerase-3 subunit delta|nr:DNA polymerase III subunit delta [Bacteroidota bacterium]
MTDRDLQRHITKKSFLPVYLLYGEEDFLIERTAKAMVSTALGDSDPSFNLDLFRGTENKADEIVAAANAFPFMGEKRVVFVRESDPLLKQPALAQYVRNPSTDTVLILCAGALKPPRASRAKKPAATADVLSLLRTQEQSAPSAAGVVEYKALRDSDALQWIVREIERGGKSISPEACTVFHALKGNNTRELSSEIEKLLIAVPDHASIEVEDIYDHLGASRQYNVFELSTAVMERNARRAQEIAQHLLRSDEPLMLVNTLWRQLSQLWRVRGYRFGARVTDEDVRALGLIWAWQVEHYRKYSGNFRDHGYFERCFEYILDADVSIKSRPGDPGIVVTRLITQLTSA